MLSLDHLRFIHTRGGFESISYQEIHSRAKALGRDPNQSALYFSVVIPFVLYYLMIYKGVIKRAFLMACLIVFTSAVILTHSMGGAMRLTFIAVFFLLLHKNIGIEKKAILFICLVSIFFGVYVLNPSFKPRVQHQYNVIQNEDFTKWGTGRGSTWLGALNTIKENPIIGVGLGNAGYEIARLYYLGRREYKVAHNTFLAIVVETGIVGLFLFVMLISSIPKKNVYKAENIASYC